MADLDDTAPRRPRGCQAYIDAIPCDLTIRIPARPELARQARSASELDPADRAKLIAAIRAGEHVELEFSAITYRQRDGKPNRNYVRFRPSKLPKVAKTGRGTPFLLDHRQYSVGARVGTVLESRTVTSVEGAELAEGEIAFRQRILVVKPEAVIGVLDGTIDRFSIGWHATGEVVCSIHGGLARRECACRGGDEVEVDGVTRIAEYEFTDAELVEVSAVNVPAVVGTGIEEVRAALAAEIAEINHHHRSTPMTLNPRIAAVLRLAPAATEQELVAAVDELGQRAARVEAERDVLNVRTLAAEAERDRLRTELATATASALTSSIDAAIAGAYAACKLVRKTDDKGQPVADPVEATLRRLGELAGVTEMQAQINALDRKAPIGLPPPGGAPPPAPGPIDLGAPGAAPGPRDPQLELVATQLKIPYEEVAATYAREFGGR